MDNEESISSNSVNGVNLGEGRLTLGFGSC